MTQPPGAEPREPSAASPVLHDAVVGGHNIQITSARDITIAPWPFRKGSRTRLLIVSTVLIIGVVAAGMWPTVADAARDLAGTPALTGTATTRLNVGDSLAMRGELSRSEAALLLRGPNDPELAALLSQHQAARLNGMDVVLVLQGQRHTPIRVVDVRPKVIRSGPPPAGTCLTLPSQGGAEEYEVKVNLDVQRPEGGGSRFLPKSIDLAYGERTTVQFTAKAELRWYEWEIEVVYAHSSDGPLESAFFREPGGQPFRVTGQAQKYSTVWNDPTGINVGYRIWRRNGPCHDAPLD